MIELYAIALASAAILLVLVAVCARINMVAEPEEPETKAGEADLNLKVDIRAALERYMEGAA